MCSHNYAVTPNQETTHHFGCNVITLNSTSHVNAETRAAANYHCIGAPQLRAGIIGVMLFCISGLAPLPQHSFGSPRILCSVQFSCVCRLEADKALISLISLLKENLRGKYLCQVGSPVRTGCVCPFLLSLLHIGRVRRANACPVLPHDRDQDRYFTDVSTDCGEHFSKVTRSHLPDEKLRIRETSHWPAGIELDSSRDGYYTLQFLYPLPPIAFQYQPKKG